MYFLTAIPEEYPKAVAGKKSLALFPLSQTTIFPLTSLENSEPWLQDSAPFPPALLPYTNPNFCFTSFPEYNDSPRKTRPSPSSTKAGNLLSRELAATVIIQGAVLLTLEINGPEFPAELHTKTPFWVAPNAAMAILSNVLAPISFLLQFAGEKPFPVSHVPFQRAGTGEIPASRKLTCSGHIPAEKLRRMGGVECQHFVRHGGEEAGDVFQGFEILSGQFCGKTGHGGFINVEQLRRRVFGS
nr:hypothetical protein BC477_04065 [Ipomoea trifida]